MSIYNVSHESNEQGGIADMSDSVKKIVGRFAPIDAAFIDAASRHRLGGVAFRVYLQLAIRAGHQKRWKAKNDDIAEWANASSSAVRKAIAELRTINAIEVTVANGGRGVWNEYRIVTLTPSETPQNPDTFGDDKPGKIGAETRHDSIINPVKSEHKPGKILPPLTTRTPKQEENKNTHKTANAGVCVVFDLLIGEGFSLSSAGELASQTTAEYVRKCVRLIDRKESNGERIRNRPGLLRTLIVGGADFSALDEQRSSVESNKPVWQPSDRTRMVLI